MVKHGAEVKIALLNDAISIPKKEVYAEGVGQTPKLYVSRDLDDEVKQRVGYLGGKMASC